MQLPTVIVFKYGRNWPTTPKNIKINVILAIFGVKIHFKWSKLCQKRGIWVDLTKKIGKIRLKLRRKTQGGKNGQSL